MDITQLRYFLKATETMNYTRAAESLFISRQALCQSLTALERELGQPLFENDHNHLSLTLHGAYLQKAFRDLVADFQREEARAKAYFRQPVKLELVLAASMIPYFLPGVDQILAEFKNRYPDMRLEARQLSDDRAIETMEEGEADCGCILRMAQPGQQPGCTATVLRTIPVGVGSGPLSPFYQKTILTLEELSSVPLISMGDPARVALPLWEDCRRRGLTLHYRVITNVVDAMHLFQTGAESGFTVFSQSEKQIVAQPDPYTSALLPGYTWEVVALCPTSRPNHAAAQLLADFLREKYSHPDVPLP